MTGLRKIVLWGLSRMCLGFLSFVIFLPTVFVPIWVDRSEQTLATVGETVYYGFPLPVRSVSDQGSDLEGLLPASAVDVVFWTGLVAFCDRRFLRGGSRERIAVSRFVMNWLAVLLGFVTLVILVFGGLFAVDAWRMP